MCYRADQVACDGKKADFKGGLFAVAGDSGG